MSTILRQASLRFLRSLGIRHFRSRSSLGHPFVCHLGDSLSENPFYNAELFRCELELCRALLQDQCEPVVFDVGAHAGFWSTQLAQMLQRKVSIYAFEPAPMTFRRL